MEIRLLIALLVIVSVGYSECQPDHRPTWKRTVLGYQALLLTDDAPGLSSGRFLQLQQHVAGKPRSTGGEGQPGRVGFVRQETTSLPQFQ